ncbi:MAG: hypothetical protein WA628_15545 [Terriglobales bacterium]
MKNARRALFRLEMFLGCALVATSANAHKAVPHPVSPNMTGAQKVAPGAKSMAGCCGTHAYEVDGVEVTLISLERTNPNEITARWRYQNTTAAPKNLGESFHGMGSSEAFSLVWDAYVVDPIAKVKYPILKDDRGTPVGYRHGGRKVVTLPGNEATTVWAKFQVPVSAGKLSVYLPGTEPFENVTATEMGKE